MQNINQQKYDLEALQPFIPLAKQLQSMKIDITNFMPWAETIQEISISQNTDLTTAAYKIAQELRLYCQLQTLQKCVDQTQEQLTVLNTFTAQKQKAITALSNLQNMGIKESEIVELVNFVGNLRQYGKDIGMHQGNGNNDMNGGSTNNGCNSISTDNHNDGSNNNNERFKWDSQLLSHKKPKV
jgi:hypothetical protein